jgi:hypothetical protein
LQPAASIAEAARRLGLEVMGDGILIPFFAQRYVITGAKIADEHGTPPTEAVAAVIRRYLAAPPATPPPSGEWLSFRELKEAGPLAVNFANNTNKLIVTTFSRAPQTLASAGVRAGGVIVDEPGYDVSLSFQALPHIDLSLKFNAADEAFSAQSQLLFRRSAQSYLDIRSLFTLGTYLAGLLITIK